MKYLLIMLSLLALGCGEAETVEKTSNYILPEGLKDCRIYSMEGFGNSKTITVVRCPLSITGVSYQVQSGKTSHTEYVSVVESI